MHGFIADFELDFAARGRIKADKQLCERAFAAAVFAGERDDLARVHLRFGVGQDDFFFVIRKGEVFCGERCITCILNRGLCRLRGVFGRHGYDVYAGGAGNNNDGDAKDGRSGGFVGFNDEGLLKNNNMYYCDVVRGTKDLVGPFSGISKLDSQYKFNTLEKVEGEDNNYRIYRKLEKTLDQIKKNSDRLNLSYEKDASSGWDIYTLGHMNSVKSYDTLKNAKLTDDTSSTTAELKAYESSAKAVLMADTKTTLNTGESGTPEPSESQDPCDEHIKLTINKVWKDLNNFDKSRPNSITVTISRTWKDKAGNEMTEPVPGYESYKIEGSIDKSKWQEVIKELPAYKTDGDEIYYYTYSITEAEVDGYTTTINKSQDGFTFTITNKHFPSLPDTGGYGSYLIYLIAVLLFLVYFIMRYKKCKENKKAEKL